MLLEIRKAASDCERRAAEFRQEAEKALLPSKQALFLELEQHWLHLACIYYQTDRMMQVLRSSDRSADVVSQPVTIH